MKEKKEKNLLYSTTVCANKCPEIRAHILWPLLARIMLVMLVTLNMPKWKYLNKYFLQLKL